MHASESNEKRVMFYMKKTICVSVET